MDVQGYYDAGQWIGPSSLREQLRPTARSAAISITPCVTAHKGTEDAGLYGWEDPNAAYSEEQKLIHLALYLKSFPAGHWQPTGKIIKRHYAALPNPQKRDGMAVVGTGDSYFALVMSKKPGGGAEHYSVQKMQSVAAGHPSIMANTQNKLLIKRTELKAKGGHESE